MRNDIKSMNAVALAIGDAVHEPLKGLLIGRSKGDVGKV